MTDATIVIIGGQICAVIASLGALALSWRAAVKAETAASHSAVAVAKTAVVTEKTNELLTETAKIHELANENFGKSQTALQVANEKIEGLQKLLGAMADNLILAKTPAPPPEKPLP